VQHSNVSHAAYYLITIVIQDGPGVIIWHDISSRALETANVLCEQLGIGRERVIPEYAFLEPRGMGLWESGESHLIILYC
jgi:hypothetical protein